MSKHCDDCGCLKEGSLCTNCDEVAVSDYYDSLPDESNVYERYKA